MNASSVDNVSVGGYRIYLALAGNSADWLEAPCLPDAEGTLNPPGFHIS